MFIPMARHEYVYDPNSRDRLLQRITHRMAKPCDVVELTCSNIIGKVSELDATPGGITRNWAPT